MPSITGLLRWQRLLILVPLVCLVTCVAWLCPGGLWFFGDITDYTLERRGMLVSDVQEATKQEAGTVTSYHRLTSDSGLVVEAAIKRPVTANARLPLVILIGGFRTGRDAVDLIQDQGNTVVAALSYPYEGNRRIRSARGWLTALRPLRRSMHDSPAALMLTLDYLLQKPYVDTTRVELVGVSLGSFLVTVAGALDERVTRVWCVHGGADYRLMLDAALLKNVPNGWVRKPLKGFGNLLVNRLDPKDYVGRIAPRPVVMINARNDDRIPREATKLLHDRTQEPKEIIWLDTQHVSPKKEEIIRNLVTLVLGRIDRQAAQ